MTIAYDPHSSTLYNADTGVAVAILLDDLPAAERHALGRLFAAAEGMRRELTDALAFMKERMAQDGNNGVSILIRHAEAALRATEPPA
jgi:hypothetical protein